MYTYYLYATLKKKKKQLIKTTCVLHFSRCTHHVEGTWTTTLDPSRVIWGA